MSRNAAQDLGQIVAMVGTVLSSLNDLRGETRARFDKVEASIKELEWGQKDLRQAVTAYHASVMGHGILISELEARVQRIEAHHEPLDLISRSVQLDHRIRRPRALAFGHHQHGVEIDRAQSRPGGDRECGQAGEHPRQRRDIRWRPSAGAA